MNPTTSAPSQNASSAARTRLLGSGPDDLLTNDPSIVGAGAALLAPLSDAPWWTGYFPPPYSVTFTDPGSSADALVSLATATAPSAQTAAPTQVLYLQEAGTSAPISVYDINQGQMGDCYLLSSIGEIALFHPSLITKMIQANADGTETVTLYRASNGSLPTFGTTAYTPVAINVTDSFPGNSVNNGSSQDVLNGQKEIWVQVLEKAVSTLYGGYNGIANGGIPSISMEELTGSAAISTSPGAVSLQQLQTDIAAGDLLAFDTPENPTLPYGLYGDHAYMFQSLTSVNGAVMVNLLNPWGFDEPAAIPFSQIGAVCDEIDIGQFTAHAPGPSLVQQVPNQTWAQGSHVSFALPSGAFSDSSGGKLTYVATQANGQACPSWLSFNATTMTFSGTVPSGMETLSLKVTATDSSGLSCSETFAVTVPAAAPTMAHQTAAQTWTEGARLSFTLPSNTFADPNGEALSYAATLSNGQALPSWLTLNSTTGTFTGTVGYTAGTMMIKVTATDTSGLSASETLQATLVAPPPALTNQTPNQTWTAGRALSFMLASGTFTAVPGQTLKYTATLPTGLTINASTGTISGTVPVTLGIDAITVTGTETGGLAVSETFKATVVASAPTVHQTATQTWTANKGVSLSVAGPFADPQGEQLTYTATMADGSTLPAWLKFNTTSGAFTGTAPVALQTLTFAVTATDQSGLSTRETFQASVQAAAPTVGNQTGAQMWAAGKAVSLTLASNTFVDPQGEKLTLSATLANGSALPNGLTFNATTGAFSGTAPITPETLGLKVTATDASGLSVSEQFSATVQAAAPTLAHQTANQVWTDGATMNFLVLANTFADPQGAALSYAAYQTSGPDQTSWLHFAAGLAEFTGAIPAALAGTIGIKIVATDAYGLSTSESYGLTFEAVGAHLSSVSPPGATEMLALHG